MTIREIMRENKVTVAKLAAELGITENALYMKFRGSREWSVEQALAAQEFFEERGVTVPLKAFVQGG